MDILAKLLEAKDWGRDKAMSLADLLGPQVDLGGGPIDEGEAIDQFSGVGPTAAIATRALRFGSVSPAQVRRMVGPKARPRTEEELVNWEREMFRKKLERENPMGYVRQGPSMHSAY